MKNKAISLLLCTALMASSGAMAFAADTDVPAAPKTTAAEDMSVDMTFTGVPIKLSLEAATTRMQTEGYRAESLKINDLRDKQIADNYAESVKRTRDALENSGDGLSSSQVSLITERTQKLSRDFAKANLQSNHQAEMNKIEEEAISAYYALLLAQDKMTAATDNLAVEKTILSNVQKKFNAGVAAKKDVLSAQKSVVEAESSLTKAKVELNNSKMKFNLTMGYPLMQRVELTDTLKELPAPTTSLADAISSALKNRMEPKGAELNVQIIEMVLNNLKLTIATNSATYLDKQVQYMKAKQALDTAPASIEQDVRQKYMAVEENAAAVKSAKETLSFAKEAYRLAQISYDAGVNTLTDVQEAQILAFQTQQALSGAVMGYDLAVYEYEFSYGVGTERIAL